MSQPSDDDARLMARVANADRDAFATLFDRHSPVVLGVLCRMLGDRAEAEEILQEAFLQAWEQAGRYRPELSAPRSWLITIARSRAIDRIRSRSSRRRREEAVFEERPGGASVEPEGEERLAAADRRREVASALGGLPPEQRECVELAFFGGLTHREIAERLGRPLGTVKSRILLGMNKLRSHLDPATL